MCVYLRLVGALENPWVHQPLESSLSDYGKPQDRRTCAHHPLTIITGPNTLAGFFEFEVL